MRHLRGRPGPLLHGVHLQDHLRSPAAPEGRAPSAQHQRQRVPGHVAGAEECGAAAVPRAAHPGQGRPRVHLRGGRRRAAARGGAGPALGLHGAGVRGAGGAGQPRHLHGRHLQPRHPGDHRAAPGRHLRQPGARHQEPGEQQRGAERGGRGPGAAVERPAVGRHHPLRLHAVRRGHRSRHPASHQLQLVDICDPPSRIWINIFVTCTYLCEYLMFIVFLFINEDVCCAVLENICDIF